MPSSAKAATAKAAVIVTNDEIIKAAAGRWGEVVSELKAADPYVIQRPNADDIVITPLTRRRRKALKAAQAAYLMVGAQLGEAQADGTADQGTITRISQILEDAEYEYDRALFGDACDEIYSYYEDLQEEFWDAMYQDVHNALVNRVTPPEDVCSKCGQKIEDGETEGKEDSSSTSLSGTGTK